MPHEDTMPHIDRLISTREAAIRLGLSTERVRQLIRAGILPVHQIGLWYFLDRADVEALVAGRAADRAKAIDRIR